MHTNDRPRHLRQAALGLEGVGAADAPRTLDPARDVDAAGAMVAVDGVQTDPDVELATALSTGAVGPDEARGQLIDQAVRGLLPDHSGSEFPEKIRDLLAALLADDPTLAALLDGER